MLNKPTFPFRYDGRCGAFGQYEGMRAAEGGRWTSSWNGKEKKPDGDLWEESCKESWVSVTFLTADLRDEARRLEAELFGPRATQAGPTSRRANHREDVRRRQERERGAQQWRARLRDRTPPPSSA